MVAAVLGPPQPGKAQSFEDQYISSGGQLYELMAGHDRFVADLRPLFERRRPGGAALCCHPYDLCTELIARELGVLVTDEQGRPLARAARRDIGRRLDRLCERRARRHSSSRIFDAR